MKRGSKKRVSRKKRSSGERVTKIIHESTKEIKIERALVENFIALQKVMVNLSGKFDNLSGQISKLLELFEISAKSLAKKDFENLEKESKDTKRIVEKLDNLTQQAGLIGRGLALIHESSSEGNTSENSMSTSFPAKPIGQMTQTGNPMSQPSAEEYRKSVLPRVSETNE